MTNRDDDRTAQQGDMNQESNKGSDRETNRHGGNDDSKGNSGIDGSGKDNSNGGNGQGGNSGQGSNTGGNR